MSLEVYSIDKIKELMREVLENTDVDKAVLFGSYAKHTATPTSDVDIMIDSEGKIKGLQFFLLIDLIKEKLAKDVDVVEKIEIEPNSRIEEEINKTGVVIYER